MPLEEAQQIFDRYHNELYPEISDMRKAVLDTAIEKGRIHLGLGCFMNTSDPEKEVRTLFNALTIYQF